jgi:alpha-glucoside transport system permease protein
MAYASGPAGGYHPAGTALAGRPGASGAPRRRAGSMRRLQRERRTIATLFLAPALVMLAVLVVWPLVNTFWLSLHNAGGTRFVGLANYVTMFQAPETRRAITNNVIWVAVAPTVVTVLGLMFAVLTERIRAATAFKIILFMPMAVSLLAAGVTWRLVYDQNPDRGVLNAIVVGVHDLFAPPTPYSGMHPRDKKVLDGPDGGDYRTVAPVRAGNPALLPLVGLAPDKVPATAKPAAAPSCGAGLCGVVWLDFTRGGGGTAGEIDPAERGLPGMTVEALRDGAVVATAKTDATGAFAFPSLAGDGYTVRLPRDDFAQPFSGVSWLGPSLITPSIIVSYLWIWAGFAMVLISAGLAALPRESLEAARVDGATEWQVFRRVTVPLVRPVLIVVLVTLIINVLKIFDLVYILTPDSSQGAATVVAVEMYKVSFGGGQDSGLGSALGVLLFLLVVPAMVFNVRRLRRDER